MYTQKKKKKENLEQQAPSEATEKIETPVVTQTKPSQKFQLKLRKN